MLSGERSNRTYRIEIGETIDKDFLKDCEIVFKGCIAWLHENAEPDFETAEKVLDEIQKQLRTEELVSRFKEEMTKYVEAIISIKKRILDRTTRLDTQKEIQNEVKFYEMIVSTLKR